MTQKAEVEIQEKPKSPQEEALDKLLKEMEKPIQPPPIEETLGKVKQALDQAAKAVKPKQRTTWHCTECGGAHVQLYMDGKNHATDHFAVDLEDGEPVNPRTGEPIKADAVESMRLARAKSGK